MLEKNYNNKINKLHQLADVTLADNLNKFFNKVYNLLYLNLNNENYNDKISNISHNEELINKLDKFQENLTNLLDNKIHNINSVNQSNIAVNPNTYNTIKKQIAINSEFKSPASQLSIPSNCGVTGNPDQVCDKDTID